MPKLIIDGIEVEAESGVTLLAAGGPLLSSCPGLTRASTPLSAARGAKADGMDCRIKSGSDGLAGIGKV
jgi:hypothetical protein